MELQRRGSFGTEEGQEEILSLVGVFNCTPMFERRSGNVKLFDRICSQPKSSVVVVGCVPLFLKVNERLRYLHQSKIRWGTTSTKKGLDRVLADASHLAVVECPGQDTALPGYVPVAYGLVDQKMKQRVVCGRDGPAEARRLRIRALPVRQMIRLFQQVIGKRHRLCPSRFLQFCLFRLASEVEMWKHPKLHDVEVVCNAVDNPRPNLVVFWLARFVGEQDEEIGSPIAGPILPESETDLLDGRV